VPKVGTKGYEKIEHKAIDTLLETAWIYGEAAEMGIAVTHTQVAHELAQIKKESFKSSAEYRQFLKESHYTRRDVDERVEMQLLTARMQRRIARRIERQSRMNSRNSRVSKNSRRSSTKDGGPDRLCSGICDRSLLERPAALVKAERSTGSRAGRTGRATSARSVPVGVGPSQACALRPFFLLFDPFSLLSTTR
jgi:hypothetical protein